MKLGNFMQSDWTAAGSKLPQKHDPNTFYDLEAVLAEESVQFATLFIVILDKQKANLDHIDGKCIELQMYLFIVENELHSTFPNVEIVFCMCFLCLMVSNYAGERSFSKLRRI